MPNISATGQCPQCGGEVEFPIGDPLLKCDFCKTCLYLKPKDGIFKYLLPPLIDDEDADKIIYLPYWRIAGIYYRIIQDSGLHMSVIDTTVPALEYLDFLPSLGLATLLAPVRLELTARFSFSGLIRPETAFLNANRRIEAALGGKTQAFGVIGESIQIMMAPVRIEERLRKFYLKPLWAKNQGIMHIDVNSKAGKTIKNIIELGKLKRQNEDQFRFIPLICPECGHDLPSLAGVCSLFCVKCHKLWSLTAKGFLPDKAKVFVPKGQNAMFFDVFLPFWVIGIKIKGFPLANRLSFLNRLVSYKKYPDSFFKEPITMIIPAFKTNSKLMLRLSREMSLAAIDFSAVDYLEHKQVPAEARGVDFDFTSAVHMISLILFSLLKDKKPLAKALMKSKIEVVSAALLFFPFKKEGTYLTEALSHQSLPETSL